MKRISLSMSLGILLVLLMGMSIYAQKQNPSSLETGQAQNSAEKETVNGSTTGSDNATQQESQSHPSAETASTLQGVMLASDTILGATVKNERGQSVGEIQRLLISPQYGVIMYAELGVGGFLGMGEKTIMVPWKAIEIARNGDSLVLNTSENLVSKAAE